MPYLLHLKNECSAHFSDYLFWVLFRYLSFYFCPLTPSHVGEFTFACTLLMDALITVSLAGLWWSHFHAGFPQHWLLQRQHLDHAAAPWQSDSECLVFISLHVSCILYSHFLLSLTYVLVVFLSLVRLNFEYLRCALIPVSLCFIAAVDGRCPGWMRRWMWGRRDGAGSCEELNVRKKTNKKKTTHIFYLSPA